VNYSLINNEKANQYEFHIKGKIAKIEYRLKGNKIYITHTEVPPALGGQGVGTQLVEQVLQDIKSKELTLVPLCPFVKAYVNRHTEWLKLVDK